MSGYTKLFSDIVLSSIWREDNSTRIVWITLMALADKDGVIQAAVPGLASAANIPLDATVKALLLLQSPDEWSRDKDHDGRRLEEVQGGWRILNYLKYREKLSKEDRREYFRRKQAEYRQRQKDLEDNDGSKSA